MFFSKAFELLYTVAHYVGWNRESHSLRRNALRRERHFRGADSDKTPGNVDHRSATVARINRRVGLHEVFVIDFADADVALRCAQHAAADRASITDRVANDDHGFAQQVRRNVLETDERKLFLRIDLDEREILFVVAGDVMRA